MRRKFAFLLVGFILASLVAGTTCWGDNPWMIRINIPEFKLYLYRANEIYQVFDVAVGRLDSPSPLGDFLIVNKVLDPTWYPPDKKPPVPAGPDNPLGKYWLGLNIEGYGIHGNTAAWSIGSPASLGCFRMHNKDIEKLFELVEVGTPVKIVYETTRAVIGNDNSMWLDVFPDIYNWTDQEAEVQKTIRNLSWLYEPHWKALAELLKAKKPLRVEVPRVIKVAGESLDVDGFYWGQDVYLAKSSLKVLPVNLRILNESSLFNDYVKFDVSAASSDQQQYFWDRDANTLRIIRVKVLLNGMELTNAARWGKKNQVLVNLTALANQLGAKFSWDDVSPAAICNGIMIAGEIKAGLFWVTPEELGRIWPGLSYYWDEKSATLELNQG